VWRELTQKEKMKIESGEINEKE
jgi:hypothetical protein